MSRPRPSWASPDIPLALLVVAVLVLAFVLPSRLGGSDPEPAPAGGARVAPPSVSPTDQQVVPAPTVSPGAGPGSTTSPSAGSAGPRVPGVAGRRSGVCVDVPAPRLTAASFNIHSGFNRDRSRLELEQIAAEIGALDADVVLLQEVDRNRRWSAHVDEPAYLAAKLDMYYAFGTNVRRSGNSEYGTAILSTYPVSDAANTLLPNGPGGQQRGLLHVVVSPYGSPISVYVTHLENTSSTIRLAQARSIAQIVAQDPHPKIVGGDLNAVPGSDVLGTLRGALEDSWPASGPGAGLTHPTVTPRSRIDYLLYAGGLQPVASAVLPSAVSDHSAVRTVFEVGAGAPQVCLPVFGS
jgi:endonuclease/exonuclease/phosphatase family metal-dependent hydrolase